ncbi:MAG TPA: hypothetical protein VJW77_01035 [Terriglobia bacterium]|nr:hypothetical protein [Terriglobia bacterium]HKT10386.1 hypothetical protein [Terriglobia bacterium]
MEVSVRALASELHGMFIGGFFLMAVFGVIVELLRSKYARQPSELTTTGQSLKGLYLFATAALGWAAVLLGAYVVYPWYRAIPPAGVASLAGYPQRLLLSRPGTEDWHRIGMEWKEHIGWFAPIAITMVAYVMAKHRLVMKKYPEIRTALLVFALAALVSGGIAGFFGAMIDNHAPVKGGATIHLVTEGK